MQEQKRGRTISTVLSDMTAHAFETAGKDEFYPIAHFPLGYGSKGCNDTEAEYYATISTFASIAREEGSQVFILGFAPRSIPAAWIKAAELIMQGSEVKTVLIPFAKATEEWRGRVERVRGNLLRIDETGIVEADNFGELSTEEFWQRIMSVAKEVKKTFLVTV